MHDTPFDILQEAAALLAECRTASLATVNAEGDPHAANIQYVQDDQLRLHYISSEDSAHSVDIAVQIAVAVAVYHHDDAQLGTIRGVQLRGRVEAVTDQRELADVMERYLSKFSFIADDPQLRAAVQRQTLYRFTPTWLRMIDNRRGFGWKVEIDMD